MDVVAQALRLRRAAALLALVPAVSGCSRGRARDAAARAPASAGLRLERIATGLEAPLYLTAPAGDSRLFIVEQPGRIRIVKDGRLLERAYLDLTDRIGYGGERGLLSVAFHPRFRENGQLFVDYTDRHGDTRVTRFLAFGVDGAGDKLLAGAGLAEDEHAPVGRRHERDLLAYREKSGWVRLQPANPAVEPIFVHENDIMIQGVVVGVIRKY